MPPFALNVTVYASAVQCAYRVCADVIETAVDALDALLERPVLFELNTGAIARGYRKTPYPGDFLLRELIRRGAGLLLSSDCHDRRFLLYELERYRALPGVRETLF